MTCLDCIHCRASIKVEKGELDWGNVVVRCRKGMWVWGGKEKVYDVDLNFHPSFDEALAVAIHIRKAELCDYFEEA